MIYLNIEKLCWEMKSLMENNYGGFDESVDLMDLFGQAKKDILKTVEDVINQNREEILSELK